MKKRETTGSKIQDVQKMVKDNGFLKKYWEALLSISNTFHNEGPDYILALTRKAPRLLELMQLFGIWSGDIPIISEKAIDFIPSKELKGKKIIIFDDIIISGTTIADILLRLIEKYDNAEFKVVCLAIDEETIATRKDGNQYVFEINGKKIPVDCKVPLTMDERFIFCNEIVRSFVFLNKSYDVDYSTFYTTVEDEFLSSLLTQTNPDEAYSLTTVYQHNSGYKRYTFLPSQEYTVNNLFSDFFQNLNIKSEVCKVRAYYSKKTKQITLVPMVTFGLSKNSLQKIDIFVGNLSCYNELVNHAKSFIDPKNEVLALYKFLWYIISYLYGVSFYLRNSRKDHKLFPSHFPSQTLNPKDLSYLFGPFLSEIIIKFLTSRFTETVQALEERYRKQSDYSTSPDYQTPTTRDERTPILDKEREKMYEKIKEYITQHIRVDDTLTNQLATIFEGLYYKIEIDEQERYRKNGLPQNGSKRLGVGFNYEQLKWILSTHGIPFETNNAEIRMSLALDFLVDAGIQIPIYYDDRTNRYFERAYRYGEDGLSALQYGHLIASVTEDLFSYMNQTDGRKVFPQIPFEKIGVVMGEEVYNSGVVDILKHKVLDADDRNLDLAPGYLMHGKILRIIDHADESLYKPPIFTEWCKREGIITEAGGGVSYCDRYFTAHAFPTGRIPILNSRDKVAKFKSIAMLLYHIDRKIDPSKQSDYLIALTACDNTRNYFEAVREELRLFFESNDYKFSLAFNNMLNYLQDKDSNKLIDASKMVGRTRSAVHGTKHKKDLWDEIPDIIKSIEEYFTNKRELTLQYELLVYPLLSTIEIQHRYVEIPIKNFKEKLDVFGILCVRLSNVLYSLVQLCKILLLERDTGSIKNNAKELTKTIKSWNERIEKNAKVDFGGRLVSELPIINNEIQSIFSKYNDQKCLKLMQFILPQIKSCYMALEKIYNANYTGQQWKEEMNRLGLSTPDEVEETPYQFILQYDIKDSSGKEDPENKNKSPIVKRYINTELQKTKENIGDGLFNLKEDDSKNVYIEKSESVKRYLSTIMNATAEYQMFLRIGVISIQDTGKPICIRRKDKEIDISPYNTLTHTLVNRVATHRKEREIHHRLTISEDVMYKVWGNENNFILDKDWRMEWEYADEKSKRHIVPSPEVNKYLPIYIVKCYSENEIGNKKQITLDDYYEPKHVES
jgi:hypoxanthine phosphoribosyltransferase